MSMLDYAHARADMTTGIPRGVGAPPPPGLDPKRGKLMCIKVRMLDDSVAVFHLGHKAIGQTLLDEVSRHLNLLETDYFGLEFVDNMRNRCWLDKDKAIIRQIASSDAKFYFVVKFYSPNPIDLEEEYTRYLLTLQIRRDLATGDLHCSESTAALLAAYLVQSDCGDFSSEDYPDASYLSHSRFVPNQTYEFQQKIMENHRNLVGMSPGESDLALLEVARRCDYYGIKFHAAKDIEGTDANLAVMHLGIKVFHQLHCVSTFSWAKIRKLSFKRKKLLIKLHPDSYQYYKETIEFVFETRNECKNFWKKCVEHHAFFRCTSVENSKKDGRLFSKGSSFRYNGRTQKQLIDYVREHHKRREPFTRPLRSAGTLSTRGDYVSSNSVKYSVVREKKSNGSRHDHRSMPHLSAGSGGGGSTTSGTLDARVITSHQQATSAIASSSASSAYAQAVLNSKHLNNINNNNNNNNTSNNQTHLKKTLTDCENNTFRSNLKTHDRTETSNTIFKESTAENISLSLPNVLSDDIQIVCRELEFENNSKHPPKSVSGDNFLDLIEKSNDYDNVSEDSYRLSDNERSVRSDIAAHTSAQVFNTTFTTKRIGNVVVKRVVSQTKSTPNTTDDEDSEHITSTRSDIEPRSHSQPRRRPIKEYPFFSTTVVPIEIDGPNVDLKARLHKSSASSNVSTPLSSHLSRKPIYTSSGALLVKPKVISTECDNLSSISAPYASVKVSPDSGTYSTIVSPIVREAKEEHSVRISGPLPGKVLTRENMVVTPDGLKERRQKPAVPPKPKIPEHGIKPKAEIIGHPVVYMPQEFSRESSEDRSSSAAPLPPPPSSAPPIPTPFSHPQGLSSVTITNEPEEDLSTSRRILNRPALISVKSEDSPEIEKCHLYNSDIPYTLTLRNLDSKEPEAFETSSLKKPNKSQVSEAAMVFERRKSLDLVPRKRLPSPGNFSSQDHSISPTSPDGDVLEYLLRRRSMSQERSSISKKGKRGDVRRQTQPVRFDLPAHSPAYSPTTTSSTPFISFLNDDVDDCISESRSLHDDMDRLEKQTHSISSLNIEERAGSEESDALPPPPTNLPKKAVPPPPPPKNRKAADKVVEIKATTILSLSDLPEGEDKKESTKTDELSRWTEQPKIPKPEERLSSLERQIQDFANMKDLPIMSDKPTTDSPPFIDESPKEESDISPEEGPSSIRTASGLIVTDF
ncbi:unnamed protein product [Auanema sp. JU1783]|nr:unnamed protein product [Auanema sp. JU1783]